MHPATLYSKTCLKQPLWKRPKAGFQDQLSLNAGQKYCRMLQGEHSAILSTFIKLPFVILIIVLSIFDWPLKTGFNVSKHRNAENMVNVLKFQTQDACQKGLDKTVQTQIRLLLKKQSDQGLPCLLFWQACECQPWQHTFYLRTETKKVFEILEHLPIVIFWKCLSSYLVGLDALLLVTVSFYRHTLYMGLFRHIWTL